MSRRQPTGDLRGFVEPLAELRNATITASSEAGPEPGGATPERTTSLQLVTSGSLVNALDDLRVATSRAGGVGEAEVRFGATTGDPLYNWNPPCALSGFEFVDRSTTATKHTRPHACRLSDGRVVVVTVDDSNTVTCWRQGTTGLWSSATVATTSASSGAGAPDIAATVFVVPSGRLVCLYVAATSSGASTTQIRCAVSDDSGATWAVSATDCLTTPLTKAASKYPRIRAGYLNGLVCVLLWESDATDTIYQYVSADEGGTLDAVETFSVADKACPDVAVARGRIYVATIEAEASRTYSDYIPRIRVLRSAMQPLSGAAVVDGQADVSGAASEWGSYAAGVFTAAECAILADDDGVLWVYGIDYDGAAAQEVIHILSRDDGATWTKTGSTALAGHLGVVLFWSGSANDALRDLCVTPERGRAVLFSRSKASTATADDSLLACYLGGWSDVGFPQDTSAARSAGHFGWERYYLPIELPQNFGATWTASGGGSEALTSGGCQVSNTLTARYFDATPPLAASKADGILAMFVLGIDSGAGTWRHTLRISDGTNDYSVAVDMTSTQLDLRDNNAGTSIATASITASRLTYILVSLDKASGAWSTNVGRVRAWYRQENTAFLGPQAATDWTQIGTSSTLTSGGTTTTLIRWGMTSASTGVATYRMVAYSDGAYVLGNIGSLGSGGYTRGRTLLGADSPIPLYGGLRVAGRGGPTVVGDTWLVSTAYRYAVEHAGDPWTHPSPRVCWRSTVDGVSVDLIWTGLDLGWRIGDLFALVLTGCNWKTATLYRDSTGTDKIADISLKAGTLGFTRSRGTIIAAPGGSDDLPFYAHEDVLRGCTIDLGGGDLRKIASNREGAWLKTGSAASYKRVDATLETYDAGDASSGTADLWMPGGVWVTETLQATDTVMLRISAQSTADGYYQIGTAMLGRVRLLGMQWSRGRAQVHQVANEVATSVSGGRHARLMAPTRRVLEVGWDDGIDTSGLHSAGKAPDYLDLGYSGDAMAAPPSTGHMLAGVVSRIGATVPVAWLVALDQQGSATTAAAPVKLLDPMSWLYGRITAEEIRLDSNASIRGDELSDPGEVLTVGRVTIEQEV